jgi:hypothetical protein
VPEPPPNSIGRWWQDYARRVLPAGAPQVQRWETRRAFYAGAAAMLDAIMHGMTPGDEPTEADLAHMDALAAELTGFGRDVQGGRA